MTLPQKPFTAAMIVPTGIGARVGGFGGDAMPQMSLLASVCDVLITHPNVANAAMFQKLPDNALYVEGYGLDCFFKGEWALRPVRGNKVGVVFDSGMDPSLLTLHRNVVNAVRTVYGVGVPGEVLTEAPMAIVCEISPTGASAGTLENPDVLLAACRKLVETGANAIALCLRLPELDVEADYRQGLGVDPIGGIEAILSHWIVSELCLPCAHAPVFDFETSQPEWEEVVDPRAASEYITSSFLPCVLTGLSRAPQFIKPGESRQPWDIDLSWLDALVVPADALGGVPVLAAVRQDIPVIAVEENTTVMDVPVSAFGSLGNFRVVRSYAEAAGLLQAWKLGIGLGGGTRAFSIE